MDALRRRTDLCTERLGIGSPSAFGQRGIEKRLAALGQLTELSGNRLLDVGCGDGAYTVRLASGYEQVDAVDVEPERLKVFTDRGTDITLHSMLAEELAFDAETFDTVTMIEVLEHVADVDRTLEQVHRVLKPNGRLCLTTPNRYFPIETHGFAVRGKRYAPARGPFLPWLVPLHARLADARSFTARGLTATLRRHGLAPVRLDYMMPPFDRSALGQRIRPITDRIERSPLRRFGMALVIVAQKTPSEAGP